MPADDDDVHSDDDEEDDFKIKYEVPYKNATRELVLPSTTSFSKFLTPLSKKMEVSVTHLPAIGYIPSWKPKNSKPLPKLLESADDYESMMDDIEEFRNTCLAKKGGKVKPFSICLSDSSVTTERGGAKVSGIGSSMSYYSHTYDRVRLRRRRYSLLRRSRPPSNRNTS